MSDLLEDVKKNRHWLYCLSEPHKPFPMQPIENYDNNLLRPDPVEGHYIFKNDWRRDDKTGEMVFINEREIEAQKSVVSFLMKRMASNLMKGESVLNISLPIDIFETRSNLERFAFSFSFAPNFLEPIAESSDPVAQL